MDLMVKNLVPVTQVEQGDRREEEKGGQFTWIRKIPAFVTILA